MLDISRIRAFLVRLKNIQLMIRISRLDLMRDVRLHSLINLRHQLPISNAPSHVFSSAYINRIQLLLLTLLSLEPPSLTSFDHIPRLQH